MTAWLWAGLLIVGFVVLMKALRLVPASTHTLALVGDSLTVMGDRRLDDAQREQAMRRLAGRLLGSVGRLVGSTALALVLPTVSVWGAGRMHWVDFDEVVHLALSPTFIVLSSAVLIAAMTSLPHVADVNLEHHYSVADQLLHKTAFATPVVQLLLARLEDRIWKSRLTGLDAERPVFITALPRAGTTLLLECCSRTEELATHSYRVMPFVLAPLMWTRMSRWLRKQGEKRERAHGDGMLIDFDSPEAFEEMFWLANFRRPYASDRIRLFRKLPRHPGFKHQFSQYMRKIIYVGFGARARNQRYASKNNLNVSRLTLLRGLYPRCSIVVPFREPLQHCNSLLSQHRRFSKLHASDAFAAEYMRQIGHFDFGENLCPVDFDGWLDERQHADPNTMGFWLEYWIAGYRHILENHRVHVTFVDYDALCSQPEAGLRRLGKSIGLRNPDSLFAGGLEVREAKQHNVEVTPDLEVLVASARDLLTKLRAASTHDVDPEAAEALGRATAALDTRSRHELVQQGLAKPPRSRSERRISLAFGVVLLLSTGFFGGYHATKHKTLLFRATDKVVTGAEQFYDIMTDDGLPHGFLRPTRGAGAGVTLGAGLNDGRLLILSSFFDGGNQVRLMRRDGSMVARWPLSYLDIFGHQDINGRHPETDWNVDIHGLRIHPNGDIVFNFEYFGTARLSRCGKVKWRLAQRTHHSLTFAEHGGYWVLKRETLPPGDQSLWPFLGPVEVDLIEKLSDDGKVERRISIPKVINDSGLTYLLTSTGQYFDKRYRSDREIVHANKVEELTTEMAAKFPSFAAGDLLVSIRTHNLLIVIDPRTERVKWHQMGPYIRQHDPVFDWDGTIKLFNNNVYFFETDEGQLPAAGHASNIASVDPATHEMRVVYGGRGDQYFVSTLRGRQQPLAGGGFMITESEGGRAFEVDASGRKVWEYINRYDDKHVAEITEARLLDADYFDVADWSCPASP